VDTEPLDYIPLTREHLGCFVMASCSCNFIIFDTFILRLNSKEVSFNRIEFWSTLYAGEEPDVVLAVEVLAHFTGVIGDVITKESVVLAILVDDVE